MGATCFLPFPTNQESLLLATSLMSNKSDSPDPWASPVSWDYSEAQSTMQSHLEGSESSWNIRAQ